MWSVSQIHCMGCVFMFIAQTGLLSSVEAVAAARVYGGPLSPSSSSSSMTSSSSSVAHIHATFEQLKQVCAACSDRIALCTVCVTSSSPLSAVSGVRGPVILYRGSHSPQGYGELKG